MNALRVLQNNSVTMNKIPYNLQRGLKRAERKVSSCVGEIS